MARFALILSILIGLGAAFLGFKTKEQAAALQSSLTEAKDSAAAAQSAEKKAKTELAEKTKALDETQAELKTKEEEATKAKTDAQTAISKLKDAEDQAKSNANQLAEIKKQLEDIQGKGPGIDPKEVAAKIQELTEQKTKLETELAESKQVQQSLQQKADEAQGKVAGLENQIVEYKQNVTRAGLAGKVLAYNPGWNFVVLNIGDKSGLKSGAQMVVTRSGSMIGKVKVTTVEPSTSIADVLPGTLAAGESVQPGDSVVFEGKR